jgi:hypothetical protein
MPLVSRSGRCCERGHGDNGGEQACDNGFISHEDYPKSCGAGSPSMEAPANLKAVLVAGAQLAALDR